MNNTHITDIDEDVLSLSVAVRTTAATMTDPYTALDGSGLQWVLEQVLADRHLPMNEATAKSLRTILTYFSLAAAA
jgi:hypothetical protein